MIKLLLIICFLIALLVFIIIPGSGLLLIALFRGRKSNRSRVEETGAMQEIYEGISGMEDRINNIETILSDR
jgi:hypothetical protein